MSLDASTLVLLTITIGCGLGVVSIVFTFLQAGTRGARHWGAGMIGLGIGYTLIYLYPFMQGDALLYAGWICILGSVLLMYQSLNRICNNDGSTILFGFIFVGGSVSGWLFFTYVIPSQIWRANVMSVAISVIVLRAAWSLWRYALQGRSRAPAFAMVGWLLVVAVTALVEIPLRGIDFGHPESAIEYGPPEVVFARVFVITMLSMTVLWLEISRLYETLEGQATHDELTGVANRRAIIAQVRRELARAQRDGSRCSIAIFDLDFFKRVNDTWGHPGGDEVLRWVTKVIRSEIRDYDTIGRYGGEEFLLVMPGTDQAGALITVERARLAIQNQACIFNNEEIRITVSAGIATSSKDIDFDKLIVMADDALYRAKEIGRNRVIVAGSNEP